MNFREVMSWSTSVILQLLFGERSQINGRYFTSLAQNKYPVVLIESNTKWVQIWSLFFQVLRRNEQKSTLIHFFKFNVLCSYIACTTYLITFISLIGKIRCQLARTWTYREAERGSLHSCLRSSSALFLSVLPVRVLRSKWLVILVVIRFIFSQRETKIVCKI